MILYTLYFILGLCVGSFLNAAIYRLEKGESIIFKKKKKNSILLPSDEGRHPKGGGVLKDEKCIPTTPPPAPSSTEEGAGRTLARSHCPHCSHILKWYDLIPVLSFLFLRGRCRYCNKKISFQYPVVEIATGIIFVLIFAEISNYQFLISNQLPISNFQFLIPLFYWPYIASVLIIIFVYDLRYYIIPDKILFPMIVASIVYHVLSIMLATNRALYIIHNTLYYAGGAVIASGFFLALVLISRGKWMGMGDVKLAFLMGLVLGWPDILVALFSAFMSGAVVGVGLILASISGRPTSNGRRTSKDWHYSLKSQIPFGPFLVAGTFIALFWGERIVGWYWGILF
ncbi:MAG: hypothetical protein CO002_02580 [Candidatus Portnoybacteria bacterium CG_4_8_14_3_um_filter_44_10]|uniref:Prepilin peptidase n=1 Tax=Candidatus Portnoybacteria bacterium CG_4_8_14_3_um_filter_44_10 TaxID=1974802 RepID=A0A2M7IFT9_9BACT|nr:MAG: hypothetical protein CO002_02580 [Candidatus Portnoybacteria bacterium CG_4_8_14_3_um_filter_44_10]